MLDYSSGMSVGVATAMVNMAHSPNCLVKQSVQEIRRRPVEGIMLRESLAQDYLVSC